MFSHFEGVTPFTFPAGVVFEDLPDDGNIPPHVHYKIRQNATYLPSTKQVRKPTWVPGPGQNFYPYYQFGFVWVQVFSAVHFLYKHYLFYLTL